MNRGSAVVNSIIAKFECETNATLELCIEFDMMRGADTLLSVKQTYKMANWGLYEIEITINTCNFRVSDGALRHGYGTEKL